MASMKEYATGANRDGTHKIDFEGHVSPVALATFGAYMDRKRQLPDGSVRDSDNWQLGIPLDDYMKSLLRHIMDIWLWHRGHGVLAKENLQDSLCGAFFNIQGYLHETNKEAQPAVEPIVRNDDSIGGVVLPTTPEPNNMQDWAQGRGPDWADR